jgi:hypothetical protein
MILLVPGKEVANMSHFNLSRLSRIPSWFFGCSYLILIPVFALIFTFFADDFYHTTAKYESYLKADEEEILSLLKESIIQSCITKYNSLQIPASSPFLNWNRMRLYGLKYKDGEFSFAIIETDTPSAYRTRPGILRYQFSLLYPRISKDDNSSRMYAVGYENNEIRDLDIISKLLPINRKYSEEDQSKDMGFIVLSNLLEKKLQAWARATAGFPAQSSGTYWRLLYLSAMTITTVGYGDILPITTRARLVLGGEAVLGIVIIGLFLNALARQSSEDKESRRKEALRGHLRAQYHEWRRDLVSACLRGMNGDYSIDSKLEEELVDFKRFRQYFSGDDKQRWYDVLNGLQSNEQFLEDILVISDLFSQQVNYALGTIQTENKKALAILTRVSQKPYLLKNLDVYSGDPVKYIGQYVFEILGMFSVINGYLDDDFIETAIRQL